MPARLQTGAKVSGSDEKREEITGEALVNKVAF
jgi:hypothetical protein